MTAQGHLLFSVTSTLLPDLDHPNSLLGRCLPWSSGPLFRLFGHRGFTHSLLAVGIWRLGQFQPLKSGSGYETAFCLLTLAGYWVHGGQGQAVLASLLPVL